VSILLDTLFVVVFGIAALMLVLFTVQAITDALAKGVQWLIDFER
jgi:hypothetical protein